MDDYESLLSALIASNKIVRFVAICNMSGDILFQRRRENVKALFTLEETIDQLRRTIDSWKVRSNIKDKIGESLYSVVTYEKIKRITVSIDDDHLLLMSVDNIDPHREKIENLDAKYINSLLHYDPLN